MPGFRSPARTSSLRSTARSKGKGSLWIWSLDASAMIALLRDEQGADAVRELLGRELTPWFAHSVNVCEVFYFFLRDGSEAAARSALEDLRSIGLGICEDMDEAFWQQVGRFKASFHMSLADAFAMSTGTRLGAEVVTSDRKDFEPVAKAGLCRVNFFR
jgi:PIN domain nuclease of toxin-antitoxin system